MGVAGDGNRYGERPFNDSLHPPTPPPNMKTPIMITSNTNKQNKSQQQNILCSVASYARVQNSTEVHYTTATSITSRQDKVLPRRSSRNSEEKRLKTTRLNTVDQPEIATVPLGTSKNFYISEDLAWPVMNSVADYVVTLGVSSPNKCTTAKNRHFFFFNDSELSSQDLCALNLAVQFCVDKLTKGFSVLVHCAAGVNRSSLVYVDVMKHFMPHGTCAREMIDILANAKHAVNESWLTLTNPHFVEHLCREEQEDEQRALDLPSAHPPYVPAGCTNSEEEPGRQRDNLFTPHAPPSIEDLLEGLEHKNKRKRVSFSL